MQMFTMSSSPDGYIKIEAIDLINIPSCVLDIIRHQALPDTRDGSSKNKQQAANLYFLECIEAPSCTHNCINLKSVHITERGKQNAVL